MRGDDRRSGELFSYVDLEARVRDDHPLRLVREMANAALKDLSRDFSRLYTNFGRPGIPTGAVAAGDVATGVLRHSVGTPADGADGVRSAISLVRWAGGGRCGVGPLELHQEPGSASGRGDRSEVPARRSGTAEGQAAPVERPLLGRRYADRGLGLDQELPSQGWKRRRPGLRPQCRAQLPQGEAFERDPREHDRPRGPPLQEGQEPACEAVLYRACPDGEPPWLGGCRWGDPGVGDSRARGCACPLGPPPQTAAHHAWRRQGL